MRESRSNLRTSNPAPTPVKRRTHTRGPDGGAWRSPRDIQKALYSKCNLLANHSDLDQMNTTTVPRVPNCTPHVFFKKILECSFFHGILIFEMIIPDSTPLFGPPYAGLWALKMWAGPRARQMHQQLRTKITFKNENPCMDFCESHVDVHIGGAEHRGGIHLTQLVTVGDQMMILVIFDAFWISLGLRQPAP